MSFEINGKVWNPQTATEHANSILERVNAILQEQNITDKDGNVIQLKASYGNALYLLSLGDGNRLALNDEKLSKAINSFNIELCDDEQVENLLPIAAMSRNTGSYSSLTLEVTASESGDCTIPAGTKAPYGDVNFVVMNDVLVPAGQTQSVYTQCDTVGAITVLSGEVTQFESSIANLEKVENVLSSVPGTNPETVSELRQRLIKGDTIKYSLDGLKNELESLTGVSYARVYFNRAIDEDLTLEGGVELAPRHAYIVVYGQSEKIAETFVRFMLCETQNGDNVGTKATVAVTVTADENAGCTVPANTEATYNGVKWETTEATNIGAGESEVITMTCEEVGENRIPIGAIASFDEPVENVASVYNYEESVPGTDDPRHTQNYITSSGQSMEVKYDNAVEKVVYVKIVLKAGAPMEDQEVNQLKRDLITASADWDIGENVTSLLTSKPFTNIIYTEVAYTLVSEDGVTWVNNVETGCNVLPRVTDATIKVEELE